MLIGNLSVFINCDLEKRDCGSVFSHVCDRMAFFSPPSSFLIPALSGKTEQKRTCQHDDTEEVGQCQWGKLLLLCFLGKKTKDCPCQQVLGPEETQPKRSL